VLRSTTWTTIIHFSYACALLYENQRKAVLCGCMNYVLTDRRRPVDGTEEKSALMMVVVEKINIAFCANDKLVTSCSMAGSYNCIFHSFFSGILYVYSVCVYPCYLSTYVFVSYVCKVLIPKFNPPQLTMTVSG